MNPQQELSARPLDQWPAGARLVVSDVIGNHPEILRLKSLGLCRGSHLMVMRTGNPLLVRAGTTRVAVSRLLASSVLALPADRATAVPSPPEPSVFPV